jgi:hypothetical protein
LIDVLRRRERRKVNDLIAKHAADGTVGPSLESKYEEVTGKLSEIERYVGMVFESGEEFVFLSITPPQNEISVRLITTLGTLSASVSVEMGTVHERAVREFFLSHGLSIPEDSPLPASFFPNEPVQRSYEILPLAPDPAALARLLAGCLRELCDLSDDSAVKFNSCTNIV